MNRIENWPKALTVYLRSMEKVPFEFGVNDCGTFACGAVKAITGVNILKDLGKYTTPEEEDAALRRLASKYELKSIITQKAHTGDIAFNPNKNAPALMVVDGAIAVGPGENGIVMVNLSECKGAWQIG